MSILVDGGMEMVHYLCVPTQTTPSAAALILIGNLVVDFDALSRQGKVDLIASHYDCYCSTAAQLLDHPRFEDIVVCADIEREWAGITAGCSKAREILFKEMRG